MTELPNKLSGLLRIAVEDAKACEADPNYRLHMGIWYSRGNGDCVVCMAGAVLAKRLGYDEKGSLAVRSSLCGLPYEKEMLAINAMRTGDMRDAYFDFFDGGIPPEAEAPLAEAADMINQAWPRYTDEHECAGDNVETDDPQAHAPWETYLRAADILEKAGL